MKLPKSKQYIIGPVKSESNSLLFCILNETGGTVCVWWDWDWDVIPPEFKPSTPSFPQICICNIGVMEVVGSMQQVVMCKCKRKCKCKCDDVSKEYEN